MKANNQIQKIIHSHQGQHYPFKDAMAEIVNGIISRRKIVSVRAIRSTTGWGLKEAKELAEALAVIPKQDLKFELEDYLGSLNVALSSQKKEEFQFDEELL